MDDRIPIICTASVAQAEEIISDFPLQENFAIPKQSAKARQDLGMFFARLAQPHSLTASPTKALSNYQADSRHHLIRRFLYFSRRG
jgi:hypothetical protein